MEGSYFLCIQCHTPMIRLARHTSEFCSESCERVWLREVLAKLSLDDCMAIMAKVMTAVDDAKHLNMVAAQNRSEVKAAKIAAMAARREAGL